MRAREIRRNHAEETKRFLLKNPLLGYWHAPFSSLKSSAVALHQTLSSMALQLQAYKEESAKVQKGEDSEQPEDSEGLRQLQASRGFAGNALMKEKQHWRLSCGNAIHEARMLESQIHHWHALAQNKKQHSVDKHTRTRSQFRPTLIADLHAAEGEWGAAKSAGQHFLQPAENENDSVDGDGHRHITLNTVGERSLERRGIWVFWVHRAGGEGRQYANRGV
jgi:hypothetical protein